MLSTRKEKQFLFPVLNLLIQFLLSLFLLSNPCMVKIPNPSRWKYNILRALDYFQYADRMWDDRMKPAINVLLKKRNKNSTWNVQAKHPGKEHFEMEKAGKPSRWNTLKSMRILEHYTLGNIDLKQNRISNSLIGLTKC